MAKPVTIKRPEPPLLFSARLTFAVSCFFVNLIIILLRSNINLGMVCMTKPLRHPHAHAQNYTRALEADIEVMGVTISNGLNFSDETTSTPIVMLQDEDSDKSEYCPTTFEETTTNDSSIPLTQSWVFEWDKTTQANMLAAFFYGYVFTNIIGGWVADRFGGKKSLIASVGSISLLTLLNPIAALHSPDYLFAVRFIQGVTQGAFLPLQTVLAARWAGSTERGFLLGVMFGGFNVGMFVANPLSAYICRSFGWAWIFYISGGMGILWCLANYFFIYDWPEEHPRISQEELGFLQQHRAVQPGATNSKKLVVPWRSIIFSVPVNVCHFLHFCMMWGVLTLSMCAPQFFKEILKMGVRRNGVLTSIPFLGMLVIHMFSGSVFDSIRRRHWLSVTNLRKVFNTIGTSTFALSLPMMYFVSCEDNTSEIVTIFLGMSFVELAFTGGYLFSVYELAPRFAGIISGISNTFGVLPGFLCPVLAAVLTRNGTREEWLLVFYIGAAIMGTGCIVYLIFGSSELQPWAAVQPKRNVEEAQELEVLKTKLVPVLESENLQNENKTRL